jgi:predicted nucleic acid-binding protein
LAAQAFGRYKRTGGRKKRMLADFLIGGHAAVADYGLISRDRGYRHYFDVELLNPTTDI